MSPPDKNIAPRTFGDAVLIVTFVVSGIIWGLKLEVSNAHQADRITKIEAAIGRGLLPLAEERLRVTERELLNLEMEFRQFLSKNKE